MGLYEVTMKSLSICGNVVERCHQDGQIIRTSGSETNTARRVVLVHRGQDSRRRRSSCGRPAGYPLHFCPFIPSSSSSPLLIPLSFPAFFLYLYLSVCLCCCCCVCVCVCGRVCVFARHVSPDLLSWLAH